MGVLVAKSTLVIGHQSTVLNFQSPKLSSITMNDVNDRQVSFVVVITVSTITRVETLDFVLDAFLTLIKKHNTNLMEDGDRQSDTAQVSQVRHSFHTHPFTTQ